MQRTPITAITIPAMAPLLIEEADIVGGRKRRDIKRIIWPTYIYRSRHSHFAANVKYET